MSGFNNTMNMEKEKDLLKFEEKLKKGIKDIVTEAMRTEFARYMQLNEMSRVGFMGNFDIIVNTDADLSNEIFDYAISFSDRYDEDNIEVVTNTRWI